MMMLLHWVLSALILLVIARYVPGIHLDGMLTALLVIAIFSIINVLIRPVLTLLTLPLNILTLGLFSFVINAILFVLGAWLVAGFDVDNFFAALVGSALLSLGSLLVHQVTTR